MEGNKIDLVFPIIAESKWECIALLCDDTGIPQTGKKRLEVFAAIMEKAKAFNIDPLVEMLCISEDGINTVLEALDEGGNPVEILDAMVSAMGIVGDKFSANEIFVPEMLMAAKAMAKGVDVLKALLAGEGGASLGTCVIGTVQGDLHDIGKNLVAMMIESAGFTMVDLGVDVSAEKFIDAVKTNKNVKLVACSGLLTTTMPALKETVKTLKGSGLNGFKVLVGGAPVTAQFAAEIGADGYAPDAGSAAIKTKELVAAA